MTCPSGFPPWSVIIFLAILCGCHGDRTKLGVVHDGGEKDVLVAMTSSVKGLNSSKDLINFQIDARSRDCPLYQVPIQEPLHALILMAPLPSSCTCGVADGPQLPPVIVRMYQPDPDTPALRSRVLDMFPSPEQLATMLFDVMEALGWRETYMLYNKRSEFYSCFLAMLNEAASRMFHLWSQEIPADKEDGDGLGAILYDVSTAGRNVLLMTSVDVVEVILDKAADMLLLTSESRWIVTSFDVRETQLRSARSSGAHLTLLRPFPETDPSWGRVPPDGQMSYRMRLVLDAVKLVTSLSLDLGTNSRRSHTVESAPKSMNCRSGMRNYLSKDIFSGFSGHVSFDSCGKRKNVTVFAHEYVGGKSKQVGTWTLEGTTGFQQKWQRPTDIQHLSGRHLRVYGRQNKPFFMKKTAGKRGEVGSTPYHGYLLDLLEMLATRLNFTWDITVGSRGDGSMKKIFDSGKYDMALSPYSLRPAYHGKIEFSIPLITRGYFLTMKKPNRLDKQGIFQFMDPFSGEVWLSFVAAAVGVSLALAANGRLNPYEWSKAARRGEVSGEEAGNLSLVNSLWSIYGAAVSQGQEFLPRSATGRVIAGTWWFFILVIIASYTANLAAFLSKTSADRSIRSLADLAGQTDVPYGTYKGYTLVKFLKKSQEEPFKTIGRYLDKNSDEVLLESGQSFERAAKGDYIFISPTTYEYEILNERCDMVILTEEYFFKYQAALPFPLGSPYRMEINLALMNMTETGQMDLLNNRWFNKKKYKCYTGSTESDGVLGLENLNGIFYYLMLGTGVAMLASCLEWLHFRCKKSGSRNDGPSEPAS
ncbi:GRIK3 [Branchiostoma lanceolatum]|uniref:GRIK3 protein n=1 Tax=Branchiostoma lanceolatum TaxID=7740 RepID=A0A8J9YXI0_BRALA|nr:GRIK3 [Branchiostoma lanceolatum]